MMTQDVFYRTRRDLLKTAIAIGETWETVAQRSNND